MNFDDVIIIILVDSAVISKKCIRCRVISVNS